MQEPELPDDEDRRVFALHALQVLDTPPEERFDRLTRLARRAFHVPIALISLVDRERQWFKSALGIEARETPRSISFCGHALLGDATFVVEDARNDERFHDNPLVVGPPHVRFYAGQPLYTEDGAKLGTLCLMDQKPRSVSTEDLELLRDLAAIAQSELQVVDLTRLGLSIVKERDRFKRQALIDPLTRLWTRAAMQDLILQELARARRDGGAVSVAFIDLDDFKRVNDAHGHMVGDGVLHAAAQRLRTSLRLYDSLARWGGEEFVALLPGCDLDLGMRTGERVVGDLAKATLEVGGTSFALTASAGVASGDGRSDVDALIAAANAAMHRAKHAGKNGVARAE